MKKKAYSLLVFTFLLANLLIINVLAIDLEVSSKPIQNSYIIDLNEPAVFDLTIRNLGESDSFEIYSLIGVDITPKIFNLEIGESKTIRINVIPQESLKNERELSLNFVYKIKNTKNEIQEDSLSINIIGLESAFFIEPEKLNPNSEAIKISIKNNLNFDFENINVKMTSAFFEHEQILSLKPREIIVLEIPLDKEKVEVLTAGKYLLNTEMIVKGKKINLEFQIDFLEQEDIETTEKEEGWLVERTEIIKKNVGNVRKSTEIIIEKNFFAYLFTTFNMEPTKTEFQNYRKIYIWEKDLIPNEDLKIIAKTNWLYPLFLIILIIAGIVLIKKSIYSDLELRKKVSFVKTKGGQFALKVSLIVKSKNFIERIKIVDKLPNLVKLYQKFGAIAPSNIDIENRRLEWNIDSLNKGESRIFSYIIYSKIGVVGRFELPNAKIIYEKKGKVKESTSNRSFYINEPKE